MSKSCGMCGKYLSASRRRKGINICATCEEYYAYVNDADLIVCEREVTAKPKDITLEEHYRFANRSYQEGKMDATKELIQWLEMYLKDIQSYVRSKHGTAI